MPEEQIFRQVKELRKQGKSYRELTDILGITKNTINRVVYASNLGLASLKYLNEYQAKKRGYPSFSNYIQAKKIIRKNRLKPLKTFSPAEIENQLKYRASESDSDNPSYRLELEEFQDDLLRFLNSLPDRKRAIFIEREINGLTFKEIGEHVGISKERVRQITLEICSKLYHQLNPDMYKSHFSAQSMPWIAEPSSQRKKCRNSEMYPTRIIAV